MFESANKDAKNEIKQYLEINEADMSYLSDRKEEEASVIEYESENNSNAGISNAELVVSHISTKALKVTDTIAFLIISAKIKKKRGRPPK